MRKIVVIGANGFVGKALCLSSNSQHIEIIGVSRTPNPNLLQVDSYNDCPDGDILLHLAEESDRNKANCLGDSYFIHSTTMTENLCARFKGRVIYCSSAVVYGDKNKRANRECDPVYATDLYSKLKLHNENVVVSQGGCVLRIANLFGTGMSQNNVFSDIVNQIGGNEPIRLQNTVPIRDFLYIQDLIASLRLLFDDFHSGIFNAGSGKGTSVGDLAKLVLALSGQAHRDVESVSNSKLESVNILDTTKINDLLGWEPKFSLQESIKNMLKDQD